MPTIVQPTDFLAGEIQIANINLSAADIQWFIDKYEPILLRDVMFSDLYAAYIASPTDARFVDLLASPGFKDAIRGYVYFYYQRNLASQTVGVGESKSKSVNATPTTSVYKTDKAFNDMVKYVYGITKYINDNADVYPEYVQPQWLIWRIQRWQWDWWMLSSYYYPVMFNRLRIPEIFSTIPLI
jgi:hypothetical protein